MMDLEQYLTTISDVLLQQYYADCEVFRRTGVLPEGRNTYNDLLHKYKYLPASNFISGSYYYLTHALYREVARRRYS